MLYIARLVWDEWNINHIARHEVSQEEVEQVCRGDQYDDEGYSGRLRVVGLTKIGRMLSVVLAPKGEGVYYVVTARSASKKERALYRAEKGGEAA